MGPLTLAILMFVLSTGVGQKSISAAEAVEGVQSARRAFRRERFPWYDRQQDAVQTVPFGVSSSAGARHRASNWDRGVRAPSVSSNLSPTNAWPGLGSIFDPQFWSTVAMTVGILLLFGLTVVLIWTFVKLVNQERDSDEQLTHTGTKSDVRQSRVENLPFQLDGAPPDLLLAAQESYESGDYRQAIIYLFGYQLTRLDKVQAIHLTKGKTNRQYLSELASLNLRAIVERTMVAFEDVFFGDLPLERTVFENCWNDLEMFHQYTSLSH